MADMLTSTPLIQSTSRINFPSNGEKQISKIPPDVGKEKQTTFQMVCEAIEILGVPRKGASYQAIRRYVQSKKEDTGTGKANVNLLVRKAVAKGIENGRLVRPVISKDSRGVTGYFILPKPEKKAKDAPLKPKRPRVRKEQVSDSEAIVKKPKRKEKLNLSDTAINDIKEATKPKTKLAKAKIEKPLAKPVKPKAKLVKTKAKLPKAAEKNAKAKAANAEVKTKKLPVKKKVTKREDTRKDVSDSEFVVKKPGRKSLKSYSSDTDVDRASKTNIIKPKQTAQKKETKAAKNKVTGEPPAKLKGKKLFQADGPSEKAGTSTKVGRARIKKVD